MRNWLLALAALVGTTLLCPDPAAAYYEGPWCAIIDLGPGSTTQRCDFPNFEACRLEITGRQPGILQSQSAVVGWLVRVWPAAPPHAALTLPH